MTLAFKLPSSDGRCQIEAKVLQSVPDAEQSRYLISVTGNGDFSLLSPSSDTRYVDASDFRFELCRLLVTRGSLSCLAQKVDQWLTEPRAFSTELGDADGPQFGFSFRQLEGWICSDVKPVCTMRYTSFKFSATASFIVDQSCLRALRDSLQWAV